MCSHRGLSELAFRAQRIAKRVKNPSTLRENASIDEAERPLGMCVLPADLSAIAESPAKFEARPLSGRGRKSAQKRQPSDHDPLDLIEAELIAAAIVELRRAH